MELAKKAKTCAYGYKDQKRISLARASCATDHLIHHPLNLMSVLVVFWAYIFQAGTARCRTTTDSSFVFRQKKKKKESAPFAVDVNHYPSAAIRPMQTQPNNGDEIRCHRYRNEKDIYILVYIQTFRMIFEIPSRCLRCGRLPLMANCPLMMMARGAFVSSTDLQRQQYLYIYYT